MARPRKDSPPDRFTSTEVAVAAGLTPRNFGLLQERGLAPQPAYGFGGRAGTNYYDSLGIGQAALIGAIGSCGVPLLLAARLAALFADEYGSRYGAIPSRLINYLHKPLNPTPGQYPWQTRPEDTLRGGGDIADDFWLHHFLRSRSTIYKSRVKLRGDLVIEIADRQYVFVNFGKDTGITTAEGFDAEALYRIVNWAHGSDATVQSIPDEVGIRLGTPEADARLKTIEDEFMAARTNAVGLLQINISLAIRNAFDAIHDYREKTGASFDWAATAKPPPDRYDGCDENGYPLNINHHWYRDLSPEEKAKRLIEIEDYIAKTKTKKHSNT